MSATVTCVYSINPTGQQTAAQLRTAMSAAHVPIPADILTLLGVTVASDNSVVSGTQAVRTIVFTTPLAFNTQFPNDKISPFYGLMTLPIASALNCTVVESLPVAA